jgi:GNAT superfamily N-acetyltransferase
MEKYKDISSVVDYVVKVIFKYNLNNYKSVKLLPEIKLITEIDKKKLKLGIEVFKSQMDTWKWSSEWWPLNNGVAETENRLKEDWLFYVVEKDNKYVGWSWVDQHNQKLTQLWVDKNYRGNGYGKQLMYARLNESKKNGIGELYTEVDFYNKISWLTHYINDITTITMNSSDLNTLMEVFKEDLNEKTVC